GHVPPSGVGRELTRLLWAHAIPAVAILVTRSREAKLLMDYYWDTVVHCVPPATILQALADTGFVEARYEVVVPGAFCQYRARRTREADTGGEVATAPAP